MLQKLVAVIKTYIPSGKGAAKNVRTPLEAWTLLFTDEILNVIVLQYERRNR